MLQRAPAGLAACHLDLDGALDRYGAFDTGEVPEGFPLQVTTLVDQLPNLRAPLLGLSATRSRTQARQRSMSSTNSSPGRVRRTHEFHRYDDAGHAFVTATSAREPVTAIEAALGLSAG